MGTGEVVTGVEVAPTEGVLEVEVFGVEESVAVSAIRGKLFCFCFREREKAKGFEGDFVFVCCVVECLVMFFFFLVLHLKDSSTSPLA